MTLRMCKIFLLVVGLCLLPQVSATALQNIIPKIKPSVVGIGVFNPLASPRARLEGSGFAIGDGTLIVTNYHVVEKPLDTEVLEKRVVFVGTGNNPDILDAEVLTFDVIHDLAILKINRALPALTLDNKDSVVEGTEVGFTGFPIGAVLGLFPATHRGIISAVTPIVRPMHSSSALTPQIIRRLKHPYLIYQLDATAYPGNSGSALYDVETGNVVGIINKVFVKESKETVLSNPSGITYAIPVKYLRTLLSSIQDELK
ncbi:serine protease [Aestuariibacter sp. AA17]|uniref:Serine protease n=1 Tax=Fluctibacter corallii TaxID=2984329 RepID=A0ABT3ABN4_9ALTE|nr:serine protease [Aestuariibacter sp. AA17]MCV2886010.1 serine protease [Aestuariibacter sp. AA17]